MVGKVILQHPLMEPLLPSLRLVRREYESLVRWPQLRAEERASQHWLSGQIDFAPAVERAFRQVRLSGGFFGGWALSRSALRTLVGVLWREGLSCPHLVEFGSGQSTRFWNHLSVDVPFALTSFEHDQLWFEGLQSEISSPALSYLSAPLRQLQPAEKKQLWQAPQSAHRDFARLGRPLPLSHYGNTREALCFYDVDYANLFAPASIDAVILDGPNGSGRSLAFALLYPFLKPKAWILLDDFDHYPFLEDLQDLFDFETQHVQIQAGKRWCLVRLQARR